MKKIVVLTLSLFCFFSVNSKTFDHNKWYLDLSDENKAMVLFYTEADFLSFNNEVLTKDNQFVFVMENVFLCYYSIMEDVTKGYKNNEVSSIYSDMKKTMSSVVDGKLEFKKAMEIAPAKGQEIQNYLMNIIDLKKLDKFMESNKFNIEAFSSYQSKSTYACAAKSIHSLNN